MPDEDYAEPRGTAPEAAPADGQQLPHGVIDNGGHYEVDPALMSIYPQFATDFEVDQETALTDVREFLAQLTELRRSLGRDTTYAVVKNTLTKRAASEAGFPVAEELLTGPTAIAFISGDPIEAARGLRDFARTNPLLVIKGGVLDGRALSPDEIRRLADIEPREVLLARLAGAMQGSLAKAAGLFQAPLSQVARLAAALQEKKAAGDAVAPAEPAEAGTSETTESTDAAPAAE